MSILIHKWVKIADTLYKWKDFQLYWQGSEWVLWLPFKYSLSLDYAKKTKGAPPLTTSWEKLNKELKKLESTTAQNLTSLYAERKFPSALEEYQFNLIKQVVNYIQDMESDPSRILPAS